ncbi:CGNR zinc finger domain-containing protein [Aeromicrobium sp.]
MIFARDTEVAMAAAAALVNTEPTSGIGEDTLRTREELARFLDENGWFGSRAGDAAELDTVRALRPRLRQLWNLEEAELVRTLNQILSEAEALPQLVDHDDLGWHIHAVPQDAPLATRMAVEAAMAFIDVVRSGELDRLKTCAADDCDDVVIDLSRNRSRRFCESGCGNRENVRAYRERQRG